MGHCDLLQAPHHAQALPGRVYHSCQPWEVYDIFRTLVVNDVWLLFFVLAQWVFPFIFSSQMLSRLPSF